MGHNQRHGVRMLGANMRKLNVEPVDFGDKLGNGVQLRLGLAPVIFGRPMADQRLKPRELNALTLVIDGFLLRPSRSGEASTQINDLRLGDADLERADAAGSCALYCKGGGG